MKQYHQIQGTPLKFHKFFWYFSTPVGFLFSLVNLSQYNDLLGSYGNSTPFLRWAITIDMVLYVITLVLMFVYFAGFFAWKSYAWYGMMAYLAVDTFHYLYIVMIYALLYLSDEIGVAFGRFIGALIFNILMGVYYLKRRPLFFSGAAQAAAENSYSPAGGERAVAAGYAVPPSIQYCRKCGYKLLRDSDFCSRCGAGVVSE